MQLEDQAIHVPQRSADALLPRVASRDLVEAIESTLFVLPAVTGLSQDLGIPGLRGRITKLSHPLANLCGDARFSEREADALIEKVRQRYKGLAFGWITGPSTRPADLPRRLEAAGFEHADSIAGMALTDLAQRIDVNPRVRVREASWDEAINQSEMMARAYGLPTEVNRLLGGAATLEEHRGKGLYTALVARRLADARADGRTAAIIQADRRTSAPIAAKLGFQELCGLEFFASSGE